MPWTYRYEAKGLQDYILRTQRLTEMVGASALIESLGDAFAEGVLSAGGEVIVGAAGVGTATFPNLQGLAAFASMWPFELEETAPGLQMIHAWTEGPFPSLLPKLDAVRNAPWADLPEAGPLVARTGRTGLPAVGRNKGELEDRSIFARRAKYEGLAQEDHAEGSDDVSRALLGDLGVAVTDIERFGRGYLAVVHADGNGVGAHIIDVFKNDLGGLKIFSETLEKATKNAAKEAVVWTVQHAEREIEVGGGQRRRREHEIPMRPLVLGGDDLTILLQARYAPAFAARYLDNFERETKAEGVKLKRAEGFTARAGIAMVKTAFPFSQAYALCASLADEYKRRTEPATPRPIKTATPRPSGLMFHQISAAAFDGWDALEHRELDLHESRVRGPEEAPHSLACPWLIHGPRGIRNLAALAEAVQRLHARGPIREWLRLAMLDERAAQDHWRRVVEVQKLNQPGRWGLVESALEAMQADPGTGLFKDGAGSPLLPAAVVVGTRGVAALKACLERA